MRLPPEEVLQFIERNRRITINRDFYASKEYYNPEHPEGKSMPAFNANSGIGDGVPVLLVSIKRVIYVVDRTGKPVSEPVPIFRDNDGRP